MQFQIKRSKKKITKFVAFSRGYVTRKNDGIASTAQPFLQGSLGLVRSIMTRQTCMQLAAYRMGMSHGYRLHERWISRVLRGDGIFKSGNVRWLIPTASSSTQGAGGIPDQLREGQLSVPHPRPWDHSEKRLSWRVCDDAEGTDRLE